MNQQLVFPFTDVLKDICKEYFERMYTCESQKWDLELEVRKRDWEVLPNFKLQTKKLIKNNLKKYKIKKDTQIIIISSFSCWGEFWKFFTIILDFL